MRCVSWSRRGARAVGGEGDARPRGTASLLGSAWDLGSDTLLWQALSAGFVFYSLIRLSICPSIPSFIRPTVHFMVPPTSSCPQGAPAWSSPRIKKSSVQSCMILSLCLCNHTHFCTPAQPVTARTVPGPACLFNTGFFPPVHPSLCLWSKSLLLSETLVCLPAMPFPAGDGPQALYGLPCFPAASCIPAVPRTCLLTPAVSAFPFPVSLPLGIRLSFKVQLSASSSRKPLWVLGSLTSGSVSFCLSESSRHTASLQWTR